MNDEVDCSPMRYNWNRMSMLGSSIGSLIATSEEMSFRINLQNAFAGAKTDDERNRILTIADQSLTPSQKKEIDAYVKNGGCR